MSERIAGLAYAAQATWAIRESALDAQIRALLSFDDARVRHPKTAALVRRGVGSSGTIGTIGVFGVITHRPGPWSWLFGGVTIVELRAALENMLAESRIKSVVLEFDSPGGEVSGVVEFAAELRAARTKKPVFGLVNTEACSAAFWLAAQCDEILTTPSADLGSVGVFMVHGDFSKMNERLGYRPSYVYAGPHKVDGNPDSPLSDEARAYLQERVDHVYGQFITDIVRGRRRGLTDAIVRRQFGEGRVVNATDGVKRKMADRVFAMPQEAFAHIAAAEDEEIEVEHMRLDLMGQLLR